VGNRLPFYYYRIRTNGDSLIWHRRINEVNMGVAPCLRIGPDGTPWADMRTDLPTWETEMIMVRFGEDTSEAVYHPFGPTTEGWVVHEFGIDSDYNFHFCAARRPRTYMAYLRTDSTFQILDSCVLDTHLVAEATMRSDSAGNCMFVWSRDPGLCWAYRRSDGVWTHPPVMIDSDMTGQGFSILTMDSGRFAFTFMGYRRPAEMFDQLHLYTWGYPPDAVTERSGAPPKVTVSAYPNPFGSSLQIDLPPVGASSLTLFDILGRTVYSAPVTPNASHVSIASPGLAQLPSGTYFLSIQGNQTVAPKQIVHFK
jgi:hypothetical protein